MIFFLGISIKEIHIVVISARAITQQLQYEDRQISF